MAQSKFRFVSPGIQLRELDRSQIPDEPQEVGPVIIGRAQRGPGLRPVKVQNFTEFVEIFGEPLPGGASGDIWRNGSAGMEPTYGAYAAQAWLANGTPLTYVRLLGKEHSDNTATGDTQAGWQIGGTPDGSRGTGGNAGPGALGLFVCNSGSATEQLTGTLAAVWYCVSSSVELSGAIRQGTSNITGSGVIIKSTAAGPTFTVLVKDETDAITDTINFNIKDESAGNFARKVFNTNPTQLTTRLYPSGSRSKYFLGETFERDVRETLTSGSAAGDTFGFIAALYSSPETLLWGKNYQSMTPAQTNWIIGQTTVTSGSSTPEANEELFQVVALDSGEWTQENLKVSITDIRYSNEPSDPWGSFGLMLRKASDNDDAPQIIESFSNLDLNPNSPNYIARRIGDAYARWDDTDRRYRYHGKYGNNSRYVYIKMKNEGGPSRDDLLPMGYQGPVRWGAFQILSGSTSATVPGTAAPGTAFERAMMKTVGASPGAYAASMPDSAATCVSGIDTAGYVASGADASFTILIPTSAGGLGGTAVTILLDENAIIPAAGAANTITIGTYAGAETDDLAAGYIVEAINGETNSEDRIVYATSGNGESGDDLGITAALTAGETTKITLTMDTPGTDGNITSALASVSGENIIDVTAFTGGGSPSNAEVWVGPEVFSGSFRFPRTYLRTNSTQGNLNDPTDAYWGLDTNTYGGTRFDKAYEDVVRGLSGLRPANAPRTNISYSAQGNVIEYQYVFSLEDVSYHTASLGTTSGGSTVPVATQAQEAYYWSGSYKNGYAIASTGSETYKTLLDADWNQFTVPMFGGFNGTNIKQTNPFNNYYTTTPTIYNDSKFNSIRMAIDSCADPELVECNLMSAPGIGTTTEARGLTNHMLNICQRRADVMAVIDIEGGYLPPPDRSGIGTDADSGNRGKASTAATTLRGRQINNSYGACYYPWIQIRDADSGVSFFAPPSIAAIGTYAYSQAKAELWFAPAGFTRGGLTEGAGGLPIIGVTERLTSKDRDKLYENNINPIASFPAEGLVVFGQKTLQATRSALDRVNVRRLLIHVKKEISRISSTLLFDPNTQVTWDRFTGQARPFLESVKVRLGLEDYKVILDTTTTTPDLIDRNVMYAKIFLKPTRAIEFIAIDFIITNTGASFED